MSITYLEDAPRVLDTDLGRALGMERPTNLRSLIKQHRPELEALGSLHAANAVIEAGKGARREVEAFYLNEEQATYVTMHAKIPKAREVKLLVVRVFTAWRKGFAGGGCILRAARKTPAQGVSAASKTIMSTQDLTKPEPFRLNVQIIDGEPRVLDTDIANHLGFSRDRDIRPLIETNREELEAFGILRAEAANSGQRGRPTSAFYLNRQQALLICILSKTPRAREVRAEVIRRFDAYEVPAAPGLLRPRCRCPCVGQRVRGTPHSGGPSYCRPG